MDLNAPGAAGGEGLPHVVSQTWSQKVNWSWPLVQPILYSFIMFYRHSFYIPCLVENMFHNCTSYNYVNYILWLLITCNYTIPADTQMNIDILMCWNINRTWVQNRIFPSTATGIYTHCCNAAVQQRNMPQRNRRHHSQTPEVSFSSKVCRR